MSRRGGSGATSRPSGQPDDRACSTALRKLQLTESFQKAALALEAEQRRAVCDVLLGLPRVFGEPHRHAGLGIRKLHSSGIWEARIGLRLRLVFALADDLLTPIDVLDHDDVRRMLKRL